MALAYTKPGVSVNEIVSPSFAPLLLDPTAICVVGPAQGYQTNTEIFVLDDQASVQLAKINIDPSTIVVKDATNVTLAAFTASTNSQALDYDLDTSALSTTGVTKITRAMRTTIANGESVAVYYENANSPAQSDAHTDTLALSRTVGSALDTPSSTFQAASLRLAKAGHAPSGDYTIANAGNPSTSIVWRNTASVLGQFQTVYLDYTVTGNPNAFLDVPVKLNGLTPVLLPDNTTVLHVKTTAGADTNTLSSLFSKGTTTDGDYILTGSGLNARVSRSVGSTTIGVANDKLSVRVTYRATPSEYWLPTRCFTQFDVENKFGPAFDSAGNILNPVSFGSSLCFSNGANSVIVQALFTAGTPNTTPTGTVGDWENTLASLRSIEDINVIVPLISTGTLTSSDGLNLQILTAVQNHIAYMASQQNQLVMAICGEDSTGGAQADPLTLQVHAASLGANTPWDESVVLLTPGAFTFANPVTGQISNMGGQYEACCVAGMLARYPVQNALTRKQVNATTGVNVSRTEPDKDADAQSGLLVIEAKRGRIQVRDAITTSQTSQASRSLSVVRAKHYMMENIRQVLEDQVVGQIILDEQANFRVQLIVTSELSLLVDQGAIVSYANIQCSADPSNPSALQVRFSYLPAFTLNHVGVAFSIDSSQGVTFDTTTAATVQGI